jgi:hypothetical protein
VILLSARDGKAGQSAEPSCICVSQYLGLKLEPSNDVIDVFVIAAKTPIEN